MADAHIRWVPMLLTASLAALGCGGDDADRPEEVAVIGHCGDGGAASTSGAQLLARPAGPTRRECVDGVYENTGIVQGGDFYTNTYVSRMELRDGTARAAIRCTFEGPLSNPPAEREPRDVTAEVSVGLAVHPWGIEYLATANDSEQDPFYISTCATSLTAARWPFCVAPVGIDAAGPPDGEETCVFIGNQTLQLMTQNAAGTRYELIATKIAD